MQELNKLIHEARGLCWHKRGFVKYGIIEEQGADYYCSKCDFHMETFDKDYNPDYSNNIADAFPLLLEMPIQKIIDILRYIAGWMVIQLMKNKKFKLTEKIFCEMICLPYIAYKHDNP